MPRRCSASAATRADHAAADYTIAIVIRKSYTIYRLPGFNGGARGDRDEALGGRFPAATTQFTDDDCGRHRRDPARARRAGRDGVHGLIVLGTCGENNSLEPDEKRAVLKAAVEAVGGRVPVIAGVSELDHRARGRITRATPSRSAPTG